MAFLIWLKRSIGIGLAVIGACAPIRTPESKPVEVTKPNIEGAADGNQEFAFRLYKAVAERPGNVLIAPSTLRLSLTALWSGAHGATADQLKSALDLRLMPPDLHVANAALHQTWTKPATPNGFSVLLAHGFFNQNERVLGRAFVELASRRYAAPVSPKEFAAEETTRDQINRWAEKQTEGNISAVLTQGELEAGMDLVLVSAVFFKGAWKEPFETGMSESSEFSLPSGRKIITNFITGEGSFGFADEAEVQVLELRYAGDEFVFDVLLPKKDLAALESGLDAHKFDQLVSGAAERSVGIALPRFEVQSHIDLVGSLRKLGVQDAFDKSKADLRNMETRGAAVSAVVHHTMLRVSEQGSEAAPARKASAGTLREVKFRANRPFVYVVRDIKRKAIMAIGRMVDPTPAAAL